MQLQNDEVNLDSVALRAQSQELPLIIMHQEPVGLEAQAPKPGCGVPEIRRFESMPEPSITEMIATENAHDT